MKMLVGKSMVFFLIIQNIRVEHIERHIRRGKQPNYSLSSNSKFYHHGAYGPFLLSHGWSNVIAKGETLKELVDN